MNEALEILYEKSVQCPVCNNSFKTKKVRTSAIRMARRDSDFCPYYEGENPLFYGVFICHRCGYAALEGEFTKLNSEDKEKIVKLITAKWYPRSYGGRRNLDEAIEAYKLALVCCNILGVKDSVLGKISLRLSWFYRYKKNAELERKFTEFTVNFFEKAYTGERVNNDEYDEIATLYLLGELNRRIGKYSEAIMWFDKTLSNPQIKKKRHIELKAREQWSIAREQYKKQKKAVGD
ncbi:DUF2225 domain-containing protein [Paramaledivibacter caminithermalis]|uniref:Tetratricopeptide repeat-containing protein n=1 Tax=Paramaledivibacter caminithermalis (strain DSM 15212 / CIP 107654 / DViRD3) TaxID=1121301 RepID=A0A1M6MLZ3_PARC5|nr:DUF2225 domain-containing protein [Paramaledivibacter caminithermalis]SHJ84501.1 hypothetical protein SAMN02745912_01312 [Paramaledivibacter caminithermalis DSM 15212]